MSNHVVVGIGPDGRSKVISVREKASFSTSGFVDLVNDPALRAGQGAQTSMTKLFEEAPPITCDRPASGHVLPAHTRPGGVLWMEMKFDGAYESDFHRTDSIDFHTMLAGEVELILEAETVILRAGDTALIPGVVHRWRCATLWHSVLFLMGLDPV